MESRDKKRVYDTFSCPVIYLEKQVAGWRLITNAVHEQGGRIFLQLWHSGRVSHSALLGGELPVAPSSLSRTN